MGSDLNTRMKRYEAVTQSYLIPRMPVIVRVDGRAFHTLTASCLKPFDSIFMDTMDAAACALAREMQGCNFFYVQSDEASFLLTDYAHLESEGWFGYNLQKIVSVSASIMTVIFETEFEHLLIQNEKEYERSYAQFDARAFNMPREEVANYFLSRALDWQRNSLQMYARSCFSHQQLYGKKAEDMHEMLHSIGKNWATDLSHRERNGWWVIRGTDRWHQGMDILPNYESIAAFVDPLVNPPEEEKAIETERP